LTEPEAAMMMLMNIFARGCADDGYFAELMPLLLMMLDTLLSS
jgi:hypothetical protein